MFEPQKYEVKSTRGPSPGDLLYFSEPAPGSGHYMYLRIMEEYGIYCGGEFVTEGEKLNVTNKFTGKVFASTWQATPELLNRAIATSQATRRTCAELSAYEKRESLEYIAKTLEKNKSYHTELLATESGKPVVYARAEIDRAINTFLIAADECKRIPRELISLDWTPNGRNKEGQVRYFPAGIVAGIAPFNFPLNLAVHKVAPAIAAGCPIILKPASTTPLSTLALAKIIDKSGLPKGAVSILPMTRKTGNMLATDERIQVLSFTGSPEVGWELKKQSGKKKVVLELGGNAGVIVTPSANINDIMATCVTGGFAYSGQICIHAQRFYVHISHHAQFLEAFRKAAISLVYGDPLDKNTTISSMIDEENAKRVDVWVKEALAAGAKLVCGGKRNGSYYEPTVLTDTNTSMKVNSEEVFGPVVCIEKYEGSIENAIRLINDTRFGLQCGIYTDSLEELDYAFRNLEVGGVIHNNAPTLRFDHMPYGGVKDSGLGREGVKYAMMDMLEARVLVK
jgi:acyl-CoA reductase-like NAD-dependent aldehyde dehydrogenase